MYKSNTGNLDDMGCTCNAGYLIGMISKTLHGKTLDVRKVRKMGMRSERVNPLLHNNAFEILCI